MHRHEVRLGDRATRVWLSGLIRPSGAGSVSDSSNPTSFAATAKSGIGLIALDDVFRVHLTSDAAIQSVAVADKHLALRPKATYTARWAIVPCDRPSYWRFINTCRRLVNANFTIPGAFAFMRASHHTAAWTDEEVGSFLRFKDAAYVCASIARNVDVILDEIGADGVYWDEHEYSARQYHYGEPWDAVSCDVDPKRMTIRRLKSSVTLITEPWRLALARRIMARGPLVGNGVPRTRAMAALAFPCFVETGSISNCVRAHLHSPIALGDHLTERSEEDAYGTMLAALDFGCVYHWYNDLNVVPTHHHLTRYMYPITPLELHEGFVIAKERIVTNRSGLFGFGDASRHRAHVFDHEGREVEAYETPRVESEGRSFTEVRIPEGWSAAIVRE